MAATGPGHGLAAGVTALPMRLGKDPATRPFNVRSGCNDGPPPDGSSTSVNRFLGHAVKGQASAPGAWSPPVSPPGHRTLAIKSTSRQSRCQVAAGRLLRLRRAALLLAQASS